MVRMIGLIGYKGAGKDTVGAILGGGSVTVPGKDGALTHTTLFPSVDKVHVVALGDALREVTSTLYGIPIEDFANRETKDTVRPDLGLSPRLAMRAVGQHMRKMDPEIWTRAVFRKVKDLPDDHTVVITDLRDRADMNLIRANGGEIWAVYRPGMVFDGHETEILPLFPRVAKRVIWNGGTVADLAARVRDPSKDRPFAVSVVLFHRLDSVLCVQRKDGRWAEPGGKVEGTDETPAHAAARELFEETGIKIEPKDLILAHVREALNDDGTGMGVLFFTYRPSIIGPKVFATFPKSFPYVNGEGKNVNLIHADALCTNKVNPFAKGFVEFMHARDGKMKHMRGELQ